MKLLLIDGYSLLFRAFYSSPPLTTENGDPTGALFGFTRMLVQLLDDKNPDYILVALDAHAPTFRHDLSSDYKATRKETPEDLRPQSLKLREMLDGLYVPWYEHAGFEADDIIGTLARQGEERDWNVTVVTGDGDMLQLATEKVHVLLTRRGVSDLDEYDANAVVERYGFTPDLIPDYKGLRGDSSDNIPGVPGIGEKIGGKLIGTFGTLEGIYDNVEKITEVTTKRIQNLLIEHKKQAFDSRKLARIITDVSLDLDTDKCLHRAFDEMSPEEQERFLDTLRDLEFRDLIRRFQDSKEHSAQIQSIDIEETDDEKSIQQWLEKKREKPISIVRISNKIALAQEQKVLLCTADSPNIIKWLQDSGAPKATHDAKQLMNQFRQEDVIIEGIVADTMLMSWLVTPRASLNSLAALSEKYLGNSLPTIDAEGNLNKGEKQSGLFDEDDDDSIDAQIDSYEFAQHAVTVDLLIPKLREELRSVAEEVLFDEIEMPFVKVLSEIEYNGMQLDPAVLEQCRKEFGAQIEALQAEIWELAEDEFNIASPKQLQGILYEKLGLSPGRSTKTGYSTNAATLEKIDHPIAAKILEYRGLTKLVGTYVDALLAQMDPKTHRIHTQLHQTGVITGRLSSSNPNLQNIPIRTAEGRRIRRAFTAAPNRLLLKADYSQIELRILAFITRDDSLLDAFKNGEDVHARTAAELFGVPISEVDSNMRRKAKMTNYAIAYGVSGYGLSRQLGDTTPKEAQQFIDHYFETLPGIKQYIEDTIESGRENGYVRTLLGRRRPTPNLRSPNGMTRAAAERAAINHPIQGSAADLIKIAMIAVYEKLRQEKLQTKLTMQVHDELIFEVPPQEKEQVTKMVRSLMCELPSKRIDMDVPLVVDIEMGKNWDETEQAG